MRPASKSSGDCRGLHFAHVATTASEAAVLWGRPWRWGKEGIENEKDGEKSEQGRLKEWLKAMAMIVTAALFPIFEGEGPGGREA